MTPERMQELIELFKSNRNEFDVFASGIRQWFLGHDELVSKESVHSIRYRLKDLEHLRDKLTRKFADVDLTNSEFFSRITDLAGVRILHLHQAQFNEIHSAITKKISQNDWVLAEPAKAFTWDPESQEFFAGHGLHVELRDTYYTSVHYLVKPRADSPLCCEIQVRTLFEEIWGEVDHKLNYPNPTSNIASREQLRVLSKLVGAGSRLVDSIFRTA
ncbi:RelA/SpoT domain-containing protein [Xanthomonas arboricola pv. corylina]|uniref:RelA/SpoT domain-containing protein n=2 Tax=Xanthomonas arboricola TaxID=56448 RepID=A0ABM8T6L3_9XANT|nr:RelA/SpoT domain-containing protein [Xanthomonas arboricola]MEB1609759.1 RelA/SpoT domain-containing protein [Xanthomonas campestris pv. campestris]MDN0203053.1 RelA/SpoT domain-containing protein [Xanthomonas arboricola pv. corylina]MDN0215930.1 RelA/SpoT domain-containing protein [Xanthomonas arboricola pv. corylina]PPU09817.1 (p)ppGpp synthetase [Xanthomonas arboricola]PPU10836.1 (p)ppGpp synthetase [Xanthomonas arboricola pv. corylina]